MSIVASKETIFKFAFLPSTYRGAYSTHIFLCTSSRRIGYQNLQSVTASLALSYNKLDRLSSYPVASTASASIRISPIKLSGCYTRAGVH